MAEERTMREQAAEVLSARRYLSDSKGLLRIMREEFEAEHKGLFLNITAFEEKLASAEASLRTMALAAFALDPTNKKPGPGVGIRDRSIYNFIPAEALEWAEEHGMCLKLDEPAYHALLKAGQAPGTVTTEPIATIATDLAKALEATSG